MNREDPYRDQAERMKRRMDKTTHFAETPTKKEELPPRSRLHREKRKKNKWKIKYPVISLLALFFILLPVVIFSMSKYWNTPGKSEKTAGPESFETVGYDNQDEEKGTTVEENEIVPKEESESSNLKEEKPKEEKQKEEPDVDESSNKDAASTDKNSGNDKAEEETEQSEPEKQEEKQDFVYHTVKQNETVYRIAMNYYNSPSGVDIIRKANNIKNDKIQAGQVLVIPKNK